MNDATDRLLAEVTCCPRCGSALARAPGRPTGCAACVVEFPSIGGLPWLMPEPERTLAEWRSRTRAFLAHLERQADAYRAVLTSDVTRTSTRNRLKLLATACDDHARRLQALLAPLAISGERATAATHGALGAPDGPGLAAYYANLHRDWVWGDAENEAALGAVLDALDGLAPRRVLVLGAGAGRLAYDLHRRVRPAATVALDVNPLLAIVASRLYAGERIELWEFPVAPRDLDSHALLRTLAAPEPASPGLTYLMADARCPPFAPASFDVVLTPWFVDVVDAPLNETAATVNRLLQPGGRWVSTGTLFFEQAGAGNAFSTAEVADVVADTGFDVGALAQRHVPYLCSPASRHHRQEEIVTFAATKRHDVAMAARRATTPDRATRSALPVTPAFEQYVLALRVQGYVASLVDGRRSLADIAAQLVADRLLPADEAVVVVERFLRRAHEDARRQATASGVPA